MNAFVTALESCVGGKSKPCIVRGKLTTLQLNMGNLCNQSCRHCHVEASPNGSNIMSRKTIDQVLGFLSANRALVLDITGGAPELNPNFDYLIKSARGYVKEIILRTNLTVLLEPGKEYLPLFLKDNDVHLISSLPCYTKENVDAQRGRGAFEKSIKALRLLNRAGFAKGDSAKLDMVYNPGGASLPPQQKELEKDYKRILSRDYGIRFNNLITITNVPINRFKEHLESNGEYDQYLELLKNNFNPDILGDLMCRSFLSVGYDGKVYDCDFNQALCLALKEKGGGTLTIEKLNAEYLEGKEVILGDHCFACTAGYGSSCQGVLTDKPAADLDTFIENDNRKESVKSYYGKVLKSRKDLKTSACCSADSPQRRHQDILKDIHPEILDKFYGCGSPIPPLLEGCTLLDLGSGTGRDVYIASKLIGPNGRAIGIDMTDEQLDIARKHMDYQMKRFAFQSPNVDFKKGYIEDLRQAGIGDNSVDVIISNCVVNLSPDKREVFKEIFRVLKPGGELYFSDVFTGRRMPEGLKSDPVLYGECLSGALYIEDFRRILLDLGCLDYRVVSKKGITLDNPRIRAKAGMIDFYSMTIRAFKLSNLEDICEDYGQVAVYLGTIPENPHEFILDDHHIFITNKPMLICGNTAAMLQDTRYAAHFNISGDRRVHFGPFDCAPASAKRSGNNTSAGGSCC